MFKTTLLSVTCVLSAALMTAVMSSSDEPAPIMSVQRGVQVGDQLSPNKAHIVTRPARYGLGNVVSGSVYAIVGGQLVRVDAKTHQVQSIIRKVNEIRD